MKYAALFRKLIIEGKSYYQLYDIKENFNPDDTFANIDNIEEKDYFWIPIKENQIPFFEGSKYGIFNVTKDSFKTLDNINELMEIMKEFRKKFDDIPENLQFLDLTLEEREEIKTIDKLYPDIIKDAWYQNMVILDMLKVLCRNLEIYESNTIPENKKVDLKDNIILYGPKGNGKNTIINSLIKNLNVPYADLELTPDLKTNVSRILYQLQKSGRSIEEMEHGIVYIRDNFQELALENPDTMMNPYLPLMQLTKGISLYLSEHNRKFDISKLIFVVCINTPNFGNGIDIDENLIEIARSESRFNMIYVPKLSPTEMKSIICKNKNGIIKMYRELLKEQGMTLSVEKSFLDDLLTVAQEVDDGMDFVNDIIRKMINMEWYSDTNQIRLTSKKLKPILEVVFGGMEYSQEIDDKVDLQENLPIIDQVVNKITEKICCQDKQIKRIVHTILENRKAGNRTDLTNPKDYIENILIRGDSGTGKTAIIQEVARLLDMPVFIADSTSYTEAGYVGNDVTSMLSSLYQLANGNLEKAQKGILVIDEIDKKAGGGEGRDVSRQSVLNSLLKLVEGAVIPVEVGNGSLKQTIMFDTSRLTVIISGAFEGIEELQKTRLKKKNIGFGNTNPANIEDDGPREILEEDYVKYGMSNQFMGRFGVIVNLNKLLPKDLKYIMKNSRTSKLNIQKEKMSWDGVEVIYEDDFLDCLAEEAYKRKVGARGISKAFQKVLDKIDITAMNFENYEKIIFTKDCITDPNKLILIEKEKELVKVKKR